MGLRGKAHHELMREHFEQTVNETEHLELMEDRVVIVIGSIALLPDTSFSYIIGLSWYITGWLLALLIILTS